MTGGTGSKVLCQTGDLLMIVIAWVVSGHHSVWQCMEMPFAEIAFRVEREGGVGQGHAVEHAHLEPRLPLIRDNLPVEGLVNDNILRLRERNARSAYDLAAGTGQYEIAIGTEDLLRQLAPLIDALLQ
ncbi:hypothetical protein [Sphingobium sp. CFD-1]|uniref:hypothetical protein n=1 Tax=Sphingobium sp. CFD-1 TaxID=2878545 RepID=UPI00214B4273|nr:hypothetical protein [Sphingobium sp. CFD-1]